MVAIVIHVLIRLIRFARNLQANCTISFLFYLYLILHANAAIFDVTFFKVWIFDLNKTSVNILFSPEHGFFMILLRSRCSRQIHDDVLNVMQLTKTVTWWPATFLLVSFPICPCTSWTFLQVCTSTTRTSAAPWLVRPYCTWWVMMMGFVTREGQS